MEEFLSLKCVLYEMFGSFLTHWGSSKEESLRGHWDERRREKGRETAGLVPSRKGENTRGTKWRGPKKQREHLVRWAPGITTCVVRKLFDLSILVLLLHSVFPPLSST